MAGGGGGGSSHDEAKEIFLNLTPMIDIMTCLLFFLLLGYRSQSVMLEGAQNIRLPVSNSDKGLVVTIALTVGLTEIKLDNALVVGLQNGEVAARDLDGDKIVPLYSRMERMRMLKFVKPEDSIVLLLADRQIKSGMITKVMKTCGMAGFPNFNLGVSKQ